MKLFNPPRLTGKYLDAVLASKWLTTGPMCARLRETVAEFLRVRPGQVVLAASATAGFQGVLDLIGSRAVAADPYDGTWVQIADATWPGMHHAIRHGVGINDRWDPQSHCKDTPDVVILTDIGGRRLIDKSGPSDISGRTWEEYIPDDGLTGIHDACHSWLPLPWADFGICSFYPTKLVSGAEGGVVVCKREEDADELAAWLYCGLSPGSAGQGHSPTVSGRKANLTDVAAALNLEALEAAPTYIQAIDDTWRKMAELADRMGISYRDQPVRPYLFQIEVPGVRGELDDPESTIPMYMSTLRNRGIPTAWNFRPAQLLTLPCFPGLTRADAEYILTAYKEVYE